uniref:Ig-like domain-containing protein n=1 Tax=Lates calcarifer TaxID=8187 RepID=A0A4W6EQ67_LATCA
MFFPSSGSLSVKAKENIYLGTGFCMQWLIMSVYGDNLNFHIQHFKGNAFHAVLSYTNESTQLTSLCFNQCLAKNIFQYFNHTFVFPFLATSTGPTVFPLIPCGSGAGDMITLGCLATRFTPSSLTFTWNKNGTALTDFVQYPSIEKGNVYMGVSQIQVSKQDWDARQIWQCAVTHILPTLKVLASSDEERRTEDKASFTCFAKDFSPKDYEIKWLKDNVEITDKIYEIKTTTGETKYKNGTKLYSAASFLTVQSRDLPAKLTCEFKGKKDEDEFHNSSVTYDLKDTCNVDINIEGPTLEDMFLHKKGYLKCHVKINKLDINYDDWIKGIKHYCIVELKDAFEPYKKLYESNTGQTLLRPSVFMMPPVEHKEKVTLTCYVKDFSPQEVFISWLVDDEAADSKTYKFSTTNPVENNGSYSAYGQLSLSLEQWKDKDMVYSSIVRSIGQRTFEKTNLVNLNMNVPETCKAQ